MSIETTSTTSLFEHVIRGGPAFAELEVHLAPGQSILADGGVMTFLREGVERGTATTGGGGFFSTLGRGLAGEALFMNTYTGLPDGEGERLVTFAAPYPGDMVLMTMAAGQELVVARGSYLASSTNVTVTGKLVTQGFFQVGSDTGFVLPKIVCGSDAPGCVWLTGYGSIREHTLAINDKLLINNGRFLAARQPAQGAEPLYTIVRMGKTLMSSLLGGEGLGMQFVGPSTVWTQSHDFDDLVRHISARLPKEGGVRAVGGGDAVGLGVGLGVGVGVGALLEGGGVRRKGASAKAKADVLKKIPIKSPAKSPAKRKKGTVPAPPNHVTMEASLTKTKPKPNMKTRTKTGTNNETKLDNKTKTKNKTNTKLITIKLK